MRFAIRHGFVVVFSLALVGAACTSRSHAPPSEAPGKADSNQVDAGIDGPGDGGMTYDVEAEAKGLCDKLHDLGCAGDGCREGLQGDIDEATETSCTNELGAFYHCLREGEITCADGPIQMPAECDPLIEAEVVCVHLDGCSVDLMTCEVFCPGPWAAACTASGDNWSCTCTEGPEKGESFELPPGECSAVRLRLTATEFCE